MRIAAIDYGKARIGLAISDVGQSLASPLKAIATKKTHKETALLIIQELRQHAPFEKIVLGLPLLLSGKESPLSLDVRKLAKELEEIVNRPILLWDERLTSAQVEKTLREAKMKRKKRKKYIDAMAAAAILQNYLDTKRMSL